MNYVTKNLVFITLITGLVIYHVYNLFHSEKFLPIKWAPTPVLTIKASGKELFKTPLFPGITVANSLLDASAFRTAEVGALLRYSAGQIRKEVLLGTTGPFPRAYLREETFFQFPVSEEWVQIHYKEPLVPFMEGIINSGAEVVALPIPTKLSIERSQFPQKISKPEHQVLWHPRQHDSNLKEDSYRFYSMVKNLHPDILDLYQVYSEYQNENPHDALYLPMDTHWSKLGIALTISAIVQHLKGKGWLLKEPQLSKGNEVSSYGTKQDFFGLLLLPDYWIQQYSEFPWTQTAYDINVTASQPSQNRLVLIGSSYSGCDDEPCFGHQLSNTLLRPLIVEADRGDNLGKVAISRLIEKGFTLRKGDLVVFEFPFRMAWGTPGDKLPLLPVEPERSISSTH